MVDEFYHSNKKIANLDLTAEKPKDWDEEIDGSWESPLLKNPLCENGCGKWEPPIIPNPEYKGKWRAPLLDNPNYQGKWAPRRINNPDYFEDNNPFSRLSPIVSRHIKNSWFLRDNLR